MTGWNENEQGAGGWRRRLGAAAAGEGWDDGAGPGRRGGGGFACFYSEGDRGWGGGARAGRWAPRHGRWATRGRRGVGGAGAGAPPRRIVRGAGAAPRRAPFQELQAIGFAARRGERPPRRGKGRSERRAARADGVDGVTCSRICSLQALPSAAQSRLARRRESRRDAGRGGWAWARARAASVPVLTGRWNWGPWQSRSELLLNTYVPYKRLWMHCSDTNAWAGAESLMS